MSIYSMKRDSVLEYARVGGRIILKIILRQKGYDG